MFIYTYEIWKYTLSTVRSQNKTWNILLHLKNILYDDDGGGKIRHSSFLSSDTVSVERCIEFKKKNDKYISPVKRFWDYRNCAIRK